MSEVTASFMLSFFLNLSAAITKKATQHFC